ncbi:cupin domain-containing protein [Chitinimonas naiadis]
MSQRTNSANVAGVFEPFHISEVPWQHFSRGERFGLSFQHLSAFGGGTQISVAMEMLPPGKQANQSHYHLLEEEHVLILEGSLTLQLGDERHLLTVGHYVCFPAGQRVGHAMVNHTAEPCRYLVLGNPNPHDVAVHPETGRVSVKMMGEGYDLSAKKAYWDGVDDGS